MKSIHEISILAKTMALVTPMKPKKDDVGSHGTEIADILVAGSWACLQKSKIVKTTSNSILRILLRRKCASELLISNSGLLSIKLNFL